MIRRVLLAAGAVALLPVAPGATEIPRPDDAASGEKRICKVQREIGSRLGGVKKCRTQREWDELQRETRTGIDKIQIHGASVCFPGVKGCNQ
jgi:hypothetical protein